MHSKPRKPVVDNIVFGPLGENAVKISNKTFSGVLVPALETELAVACFEKPDKVVRVAVGINVVTKPTACLVPEGLEDFIGALKLVIVPLTCLGIETVIVVHKEPAGQAIVAIVNLVVHINNL